MICAAGVGSANVKTLPLGPWIIRPLAPRVATLLEPESVTTPPPDLIVWPPITTLESPGAAETMCPAIVAIGVDGGGGGGSVGLAKKLVEAPGLVPPMNTPDDPTEMTIGLLLESVSVATDPAFAVEPFGSTMPEEPGTALIVSLPTVAIGVADVGIGIDGVVAGGAGELFEAGVAGGTGESLEGGVAGGASGLFDAGGLAGSAELDDVSGVAGGDVGAAGGGAGEVSATGAVVGRALADS